MVPKVDTPGHQQYETLRLLASALAAEQTTGELGEQVKAGDKISMDRLFDLLRAGEQMYALKTTSCF